MHHPIPWHLPVCPHRASNPDVLSDRRLPPYVEILVTHLRLSIYSGVINHPTAPIEVRHFFRAAGLSSALNVMRAAIQGESQLKSMPNNTAIMISFAACFALSLSAPTVGHNSKLAPSVRTLIRETAGVLERIGSTTGHRNGASALYGRYLRDIVRRAADIVPVHQEREPHYGNANANSSNNRPRAHRADHMHSRASFSEQQPHQTPHQQHIGPQQAAVLAGTDYVDAAALWSEPLQFSAMSDNQIIEAVNNIGGDLDMALGGGGGVFQYDNPNAGGLDWFDWTNLPEFGFS
jgi:hypothetical protein